MMKTSAQMMIVEEMIRIPDWRSASPKKRNTRRPHTSRTMLPVKRKISERCRYQLRDAAFHAARHIIKACPAFRALYRTLRQRLTARQAVIACANRLLRVIWRMVNSDIDYNPAKVAPALNR